MSARRHYLGLALLLMITTAAALAASAMVRAEDKSHMDHGQHMHGSDAVAPTHPGQEAFGTIQEIVRILQADPKTDWSKVNIGALREHGTPEALGSICCECARYLAQGQWPYPPMSFFFCRYSSRSISPRA
jgi:hypothetical protein